MRLTFLARAAALAWLGWSVAPAAAHYNMLLPHAAAAKKGEAVAFTYQWGHPFEHQLFDAPQPQSVTVRAPDGKQTDLTRTLEKVALRAGKDHKVVGYRFRFTPAARGDYVFRLRTPPIWMEEDGEFLEDTVKVVLHVQAQKGWDAAIDPDFEFRPLTRPYGLEPGLVFQARIGRTSTRPPGDLEPLAGALVEIEHYHATAPKELPPDEQMTRTARTDPGGVVTATLTDPGWWCLTASRQAGTRKRGDKDYPVRQRSTFWVFVAEKATAR
jgi:uncharacterized GH25 family protein